MKWEFRGPKEKKRVGPMAHVVTTLVEVLLRLLRPFAAKLLFLNFIKFEGEVATLVSEF